MSRHSDLLRLRHMLDHACEALELVRTKSRRDFDGDRVLSLALVRLLEIVGEAAGRISNEFQTGQSQIPWPQIIGLRNRLIHGYDAVDMDVLWEVLSHDLPPLVKALDDIVKRQGQ